MNTTTIHNVVSLDVATITTSKIEDCAHAGWITLSVKSNSPFTKECGTTEITIFANNIIELVANLQKQLTDAELHQVARS